MNDEDFFSDDDEEGFWADEPSPVDQSEKSKLMGRVGPPTMADEAVMRDIPALTPMGYAASEVPIAGPLVKSAIGKVSPQTGEELDLGKARYERENPNTATALGIAAPFALPLGPAKLGAQALYQGAISGGDTLARGGSLGEAEETGAVTGGLTLGLGKAGKIAAPAMKKIGDGVDAVSGKVRDYLKSKAGDYAAEGVLAGQKKLNKELREAGSRNVGDAVVDAKIFKPTWSNPLVGNSPKDVAERTAVASKKANAAITSLIDDLTARGINPTKDQVLSELGKLSSKTPRTPDTKSYLNYLDEQAEYLKSVPDEQFTLRFIQDRKKDIPYEPLAESGLGRGRKAYERSIQRVQDQVVIPSPYGEVYKPLQKKSAGLIAAKEGAEELATRSAANSKLGLLPTIIGTGIGAGTIASGGGDVQSVLGGSLAGAGIGAMSRAVRQRGSGAMSANLASIAGMFDTKFGQTLQEAAKRGKGALSITHYLMYRNNPEYRQEYDAQNREAQ